VLKRLLASATWRADGARAYARAYRALAAHGRSQQVTVPVEPGTLPVIMCTYRRLERLPATLAMLAVQDIPVHLLIWDNSGDPAAVARAAAGARILVTVHHSRRNIGGFGRFFLARAAAAAGHRAVVFIDDDAVFGPEAVRALLAGHRPLSLSGWFAFTGLEPVAAGVAGPGQAARYVGTGGMVADAEVFTDPGLFRCPRRFWFIEDVWLCAYTRHVWGYTLSGSAARFSLAGDGLDQCVALGWAKKRFRRWLSRHGMPL
jgi:glycosyltransferase involved in cell wall biosynthesis